MAQPEESHITQRKYDLLMKALPVGVYRTDAEGHCVEVNERLSQMTGRPREASMGIGWMNAVHPEDRGTVMAEWERTRREDLLFNLEFRLMKAGGGMVWVYAHSIAERDESGKIIGSVGTITDITARVEAEQRVRDSEEQFRRLVEYCPHAVLLHDGMNLLFVNQEAVKLFGMGSAEEMKRLTILDLVHPDARTAIRGRIANTLSLRIPNPVQEVKCVLGDGQVLDLEYVSCAVPWGDALAVYVIFRDVTERKRAEAVIRHSQEQLRALNETLEARVEERTASAEARARELALSEAALREQSSHFKHLAEHNRRLIQELDHRVGNNLAQLASLVTVLRQRENSVSTFAGAVSSRVEAMAQIHRLLAEGNWQRVDLRRLVTSVLGALLPMAAGPAELRTEGPPALISASHAMPLAMILVEWFINSCKYGVHSGKGGRLNVLWVCEEERVHLKWIESGGPKIIGVPRLSLGTQLVEGFAQRELKGQVAMSYPEEGARLELKFQSKC